MWFLSFTVSQSSLINKLLLLFPERSLQTSRFMRVWRSFTSLSWLMSLEGPSWWSLTPCWGTREERVNKPEKTFHYFTFNLVLLFLNVPFSLVSVFNLQPWKADEGLLSTLRAFGMNTQLSEHSKPRLRGRSSDFQINALATFTKTLGCLNKPLPRGQRSGFWKILWTQ